MQFLSLKWTRGSYHTYRFDENFAIYVLLQFGSCNAIIGDLVYPIYPALIVG